MKRAAKQVIMKGMLIGELKRPSEPTETERVLQQKNQAQNVKMAERNRQLFYQRKVEAACRIQRAWRKYYKSKNERVLLQQVSGLSKENIRRKRLRATQEEWEKQIAALTIQLAWRKYYRRKLLRTLHPNRRQLLMWDPEVVALKQQALVNYIYNETIQAPFWHPTLKTPNRPLWFRFIPSAAAVSYNFAVDQYVPWVARVGAQPPFPDNEPPVAALPPAEGGFPRPHPAPVASNPSSRTNSVRSAQSRGSEFEGEKRNSSRSAASGYKRSAQSSRSKKKS